MHPTHLAWLIQIKEHFKDPIDCQRLNISPPSDGKVVANRWWFTPNLTPADPLYKEKLNRIQESNRKIEKARRYLWIFKYLLPFVEFVGITGSVSSLAAQEQDDIDFILVCRPKRIALTRIMDWVIFNILGKRRNRVTSAHTVQDRFCFNFYVDTNNLSLTAKEPRTALELAEIIPLYDRRQGTIFSFLLTQNQWLKQFLPEWYRAQLRVMRVADHVPHSSSAVLNKLDQVIGRLQQQRIKRHDADYTPKEHITILQFWPKGKSLN